MGKRTWPVFLLGLGCLLALIAWPGWVTERRTRELYEEFRRIQEEYRGRQRAIVDINQDLYRISVLIRDFLMDSAPASAARYRSGFSEIESHMEGRLAELRRQLGPADAGILGQLDEQLRVHLTNVRLVFTWPDEERQQRGTYFLRLQRRPRREGLLALSREVEKISDTIYDRQMAALRGRQEEFRADQQRLILLAMLLGVGVSVVAVWRIRTLEGESRGQQQSLRELSARLINAQEEERKQLSRELHDEVGQTLTGLRLELGSLERLRGSEEGFREHLGEAKQLAEHAMRTVRELAAGLRPSVLDDLGLGPALQAQVRDFARRTGKAAQAEIHGDAGNLADTHKTCLYRLVQEALTNCARHAEATRVVVRLDADAERLRLTVTDDGVGFVPGERRGFGLVGMEERVRELGGTLRVESEPGRGVTLAAELPCRREVQAG